MFLSGGKSGKKQIVEVRYVGTDVSTPLPLIRAVGCETFLPRREATRNWKQGRTVRAQQAPVGPANPLFVPPVLHPGDRGRLSSAVALLFFRQVRKECISRRETALWGRGK